VQGIAGFFGKGDEAKKYTDGVINGVNAV